MTKAGENIANFRFFPTRRPSDEMLVLGFPHFKMLKMLKTSGRKRSIFPGFCWKPQRNQQVFNILKPQNRFSSHFSLFLHFSAIFAFERQKVQFCAFVTKLFSAIIYLVRHGSKYYEFNNCQVSQLWIFALKIW